MVLSAKERVAQLRMETGQSAYDSPLAPGPVPVAGGSAALAAVPAATACTSADVEVGLVLVPPPIPENNCLRVVYDWVIHWIDDFLSSSLCGYLFVGAIIFAGLELAVQVVQSSSGGDGSAALPSDVGIIGMLGYEADNMFEWGEKHPVALLSLNFGFAFAVGTFVLFLKDMTDWWEARQIAAQDEKRRKTGYKRLSEAEEGGKVEGSKLSPEKLAKELRRNTDQVEELEVKVKVYNTSKATSEQAIDARNRLKILKARGDELRSILHGGSSEKEETKKKISSGQTGLVNVVLGSALCQIMARSGNGLLVVGLYFADVYSDMKVIALLYTTGNYLWCSM